MAEAPAGAPLARLFAWLSPAFPIGGFAFSQGLETAIVDGSVRDGATLSDWIGGLLAAGSAHADAHLLALAHRAVAAGDAPEFERIAALALALQVGAERDAETREQARSFLAAARAWPLALPVWLDRRLEPPQALPIMVGALAAHEGMDRTAVLSAFVTALVAQQISVAVRLVPLGQAEGLRVQAGLEPALAALIAKADRARIEDIGTLGYAADIAAMRHQTLAVRIFRS